MTILPLYIGTLAAGEALIGELVPLGAPSVIGFGSDNAVVSSIATGVITVAAGDYLEVFTATRSGSSRTHSSLSASGFAASFAQSVTDEQLDTPAGTRLRGSLWAGEVTTGGDGTLTANFSGSVFQPFIIVSRIPGALTAQSYASGGSQAAGTTISVDLPNGVSPPTPAAWNSSGLAIVGLIYEGTGGSPGVTDHTFITGSAISEGASAEVYMAYKLTMPTDPIVATGRLTTRGGLLVATNTTGN